MTEHWNLRLHLEHVLRGLQDQEVRTTLDQPLRLLEETLHQVFEAEPAQLRVLRGGEQSGGTDRAGDESRATVARLRAVGGAAGDRGGGTVHLQRLVGDPPFLEADPGGLEGVGLDHIGAGVEVGVVDRLDHVGPREAQVVVAAFPALAAEIIRLQLTGLDLRAHGSVEEQDVVPKGVENTAGHPEFTSIKHGCERRKPQLIGAGFARQTSRAMSPDGSRLGLRHVAELVLGCD